MEEERETAMEHTSKGNSELKSETSEYYIECAEWHGMPFDVGSVNRFCGIYLGGRSRESIRRDKQLSSRSTDILPLYL